MANQILTISMITRESLRVLENNLTFTKGVNREYDDAFGKSGAKIGNTLNLRLPARYVGRSGPTLSIENQTETFFPLVLNQQFGVDVQFTSQDMELAMDDFSERFLAPAMACVANKIDRDGLAQVLNVYNAVGTAATTPSTLATYLQASKLMKLMAAPQDNLRSLVIDPSAEALIVGNLTTLFNPSSEISDQYKDGTMGKAIGFKWSSDANVGSQVIGSYAGTPTVNGAGQTGSSLVTQAWSNSIANLLNVGDIFTIAGVFSVNPQSRQSTGILQQFVVTAQASSSGAGAATLSISPAITPSGQFQNVSASPANAAAITVSGAASATAVNNVAFHRDAFVLASADLPMPKGVNMASRVQSKKVGLSVRMIQAYDVVNDIFPCRLDVLYGWATPYPQLACRILG